MKTNQAQLIAASFRRGLRSAIGASPLREVDQLNNAEPNPHVCHSHDYCDANEYMAEAFRGVVGREIDLQSDEDSGLWAAAWARFKADGRKAVA